MTQDDGVFHPLKTNLVKSEKQTPQAVIGGASRPRLAKAAKSLARGIRYLEKPAFHRYRGLLHWSLVTLTSSTALRNKRLHRERS